MSEELQIQDVTECNKEIRNHLKQSTSKDQLSVDELSRSEALR